MKLGSGLLKLACRLFGEYDEQKLFDKIRKGGDRSVVGAAMADGLDDEETLQAALKIATQCGNTDAAKAIIDYLPKTPQPGARPAAIGERFAPK